MDNLELIVKKYADRLKELEGKIILISGATGLIGKNFIRCIQRWNDTCDEPIRIAALVRNRSKADSLFHGDDNISIYTGDIAAFDIPGIDDVKADYIIHAASQTSSRAFIDSPAETIDISVDGTRNMLKYAKDRKVSKFIYLSTMEVYGHPESDVKIYESSPSNLDTSDVRSCYPESKRLCECMCSSYSNEYGVPALVLRLTQTFGPGVLYDDGRVFAEFARAVIEDRNIVLKTEGKTRRSYLHVYDAVSAILCGLTDRSGGRVYNVANESTYCSIREMAEFVIDRFSRGGAGLSFEISDARAQGYAPTLCMNLATDAIRGIGWEAQFSLEDMYGDMIEYMKQSK